MLDANFSAIVYHNLGATLGPVIGRLKTNSAFTAAQRESVQAPSDNSGPSLKPARSSCRA